jgi:hypothetical protein
VSPKNAVVTDDDREFRRHKKTITDRQRDFISLGTALGYIKAKKLYRIDGYDTFEDFVEVHCEMSRSYAYRQIDAARVVAILSPSGDKSGAGEQVKNEAQARALVPLGLDREAMLAVLGTAQKRGRITAAALAEVRVELYPHTRVIEGEVVPDRAEIEAPKSQLAEAMTQAIEEAQTAAADLPEVAADGGEGGLTAPDDLPASGPSASPSVDGPDVTPDVVHLVSQFRPQTAPECAVGDGKTIGGASRTTCPACLAWLAGRDGWKWVHGASKAYPGDPACERCGRELDEGIVKAAQTRCITCDPDRLHYAVEAGGACEPCAALDLETAALVAEMGAAEDSAAAHSEAASAPAGQPQVPDVLEVVPMVATDQPGIEPPIAVGEAPTPASSVAGVEPSPEAGVLTGGDEVEGEAGPSPSTDPAHVVEVFTEWADWVDGYDSDAIGPLLTDEQLEKLHSAVDNLAQFVGKLERSRNS